MYKEKHKTTTNYSKLSDCVYEQVDHVPESPNVESYQLEESTKFYFRQPLDTQEHLTLTNVLRKSTRHHYHNKRYIDYMLMSGGGEPEVYEEACRTTNVSK